MEIHWSPETKNKIDDYIDTHYRAEHKKNARQNYAKPTRMTCLILLEWHNNPTCSLKFGVRELEEIRTFLARN